MINQQSAAQASTSALRISRRQVASDRIATRLASWSVWLLPLAGVGAEMLGQTQIISFGFYTLHVVDPPVVLSFLACAACLIKHPLRGGLLVPAVLAIAALVMMNFVRGMAADPAAALLSARAGLATASVLLLAVTCDLSPRLNQSFSRALVLSATLIAALGALRLMFGATLFMTFDMVSVEQVNDGGRVLSAFGAFNIALGAALLLSDVLRKGVVRSPGRSLLVIFLCLMEIASGQGTATLALLAMIGAVLILERGAFRGARIGLGMLALLGASLLLSIGGIDQFAEAGTIGGFDLAKRSHNLDTREEVWAALKVGFAEQSGFDQLFGMPAGQMPPMVVNLFKKTFYWTLSIHSMYFGALPLMGYVGLIAYIFLLVTLLIGTLVDSLRPRARGAPAYPFAMCIGTAILSYSYEIRNAMLMGLFAAIWWYRSNRVRRSRANAFQSAHSGLPT